jgi:hypothetical protein
LTRIQAGLRWIGLSGRCAFSGWRDHGVGHKLMAIDTAIDDEAARDDRQVTVGPRQ